MLSGRTNISGQKDRRGIYLAFQFYNNIFNLSPPRKPQNNNYHAYCLCIINFNSNFNKEINETFWTCSISKKQLGRIPNIASVINEQWLTRDIYY